MALEADKARSELFDGIVERARADAHASRRDRRARRITLMTRLFARRQYQLLLDGGEVVTHRSGEFAFRGGMQDYPVIAKAGQMPPVGQPVTLACGALVWRGGKAVKNPKRVLLGFALADGRVIRTKGRWARLHGGAFLFLVLILGMSGGAMLASAGGFAGAGDNPIGPIIFYLFLGMLLLALVIRPYQILRDRMRFSKKVRELGQLRRYS